jgi:hypothetical protein
MLRIPHCLDNRLTVLSPHIEEIIGDQHSGFGCNITTDQIFCILQILEKNRKYNETLQYLFTDIKKVYDSVRKEVLHNILIQFVIPIKLVTLIKMCLNDMCSNVYIGRHLADNFPIQNGPKQGDALSPLLLF